MNEMLRHELFMRRALQLAALGASHTSPNPMVGAVVVHDGRIIGEGFHRRCGQAHAEVNAIAAVADRSLLPLSTLYVTLEPCSHYGKTPPCARLIIDSRIPRVVVATTDPFAAVSGRGIAMLREAGVEVTVGVLEAEARHLNRRFITAHTLQRPWILLKWAQSEDGIMGRDDERLILSTPFTTRLMHRERAMVDAIVVGAGTVLADDPSLTVRYPAGMEHRQPLRVILDAHLAIPAHSRVLTDGRPTLVINDHRNAVDGAVEWLQIDRSPQAWLTALYRRGITSVMVEGGAHVLQSLIDAGLWDEARVEVAPIHSAPGIAAPHVTGHIVHEQDVAPNRIVRYAPIR